MSKDMLTTLDKKASAKLDKYYTKSETAYNCIQKVKNLLKNRNYILTELFFIEPSAGSGVFLEHLKQNKAVGFDIEPTKAGIIKADFLSTENGVIKDENNVIIGNPPFGKKGKLALDFINKSLSLSNIVCFILPIQFRKWGLQRNIKQGAKLVYDETLPDDSFTFMDNDYKLRCCFQIWINKDTKGFERAKDLRILSSPPVKHDDFEMYQYNCTREAEKFFDYEWDFAVLRQGWGDFNEKFKMTDKGKMNRKKQWIFFKAKNSEVLKNLESIDFNKVAELNTSVKGFGKADIVSYYNLFYK